MTTLLSADALRVARALAGLSQRDAAAKAEVTQKAVWIAENTDQFGKSTNIKLRALYEALGIEFLGTIDLSTGISAGIGARWRMPPQLPVQHTAASDFHSERVGIAFGAARALLNKNQAHVAQRASLGQRKIGQLESGTSVEQSSLARLRAFYEQENIEFLGWGDVTSDLFYGVGVRWKQPPPTEKLG
ncbi:XRE family transcriptional regulator [Hoeflea sp.]|uniref:XRE family transcriptional regulator n=1 Tax=Hoeflea sp. TaxID=1940281 RepID=UPI003BB0F29C